MDLISGGHYEAVRYAPHFNRDHPFQILATNNGGIGTYVTEMSYEEAADLVRTLSLLLLAEANKNA